MKTNVDLEKYRIYNDIENNFHVAIKKKNVALIEQVVRKYGNVEKIPERYTVPGLYLQNVGVNEFNILSENELERDIKIKNLRFDNL